MLLPRATDGFVPPAAGVVSAAPGAAAGRTSSTAARRTARAPPMTMASYAEKLKQAQAAKAAAAAAAAGGGGDSTMPQVAESPFSTAMQEELKVAITILAARLQREKPMTRSEFERFESAVAMIVEVSWSPCPSRAKNRRLGRSSCDLYAAGTVVCTAGRRVGCCAKVWLSS